LWWVPGGGWVGAPRGVFAVVCGCRTPAVFCRLMHDQVCPAHKNARVDTTQRLLAQPHHSGVSARTPEHAAPCPSHPPHPHTPRLPSALSLAPTPPIKNSAPPPRRADHHQGGQHGGHERGVQLHHGRTAAHGRRVPRDPARGAAGAGWGSPGITISVGDPWWW